MQIVYLGFAGSRALEGEAGAQLVRLERYSAILSACRLAIEAMHAIGVPPMYDARLDLRLLACADRFRPVARCSHENAQEAIRRAFDAAERELQTIAGQMTGQMATAPARSTDGRGD
ncbi:hypothetical protein [Paraburkholderia solisilvae]|nr:hypothetical protein [Paraburkholderia solisilvae]